jgi:hypothetical protein
MVQVNPKSTRMNPSYSHPHKAHKRLRFGYAKVGRSTVGSEWLKTDGWTTKLKGKPPYKFLHRKNVTFPSSSKHKKGKGSRKGVMSQAAKRAWITRRRRKH